MSTEKYVKLGMFLAYQGDARVLLRSAVGCPDSAVRYQLLAHARLAHDMSRGVLLSIEELNREADAARGLSHGSESDG